MLKKVLDDVSGLLLAVLLCFSLVHAITSTLGVNIPVYIIILTIAGFLAIFKVIFLSRLSMLISGLLVFIGLIFLVTQISFNIGLSAVINFIYAYFSWLYDLIEYGTYPDILFANITFIALCLMTSAYYFAIACKKYLFLLIIIPGVVLFSVQSIFNFAVTFIPFYVFLFALILCYFKHIHIRKLKSSGNDFLGNASFLFWVIPIAVLVVFTALIIHTSDKPLEWKWLDTKVNAVYNYFYKKFDYVEFDYFSVADSGFGDKNSILGGRVRLNNTLVLAVETDRNVYLKGTCYDRYTGRNWVNTGEDKSTEAITNKHGISFDTNEMNYAMPILSNNPDFLTEYFTMEKVKVVYQNIKSKSVFLPSKIARFSPAKKDYNFLENQINDVLVSDKRMGTGFSYETEYYMPKRSDEFVNLLRKSKRGLYKELYTETRNPALNSLISSSLNVYSKFLDIPAAVPQRVYDLASSLTVQYNNNYDKVKALEEYLSTNYPYSLNVRSTPRNRDFVDYFLFDQKEGYCTYYASALTILSRCIGIPSRYVEGYILPPKPSEKQSDLYYVTNNQAHAWTEVYFEGYGWLPFEPTAPFRSSFYSAPQSAPVFSSELATDPEYTDYMDMMKKYPGNTDTSLLDLGDIEIKEPPYLLYTALVAGAIIVFILSVMLFNTVRTKMKLYKILNMAPKESVLQLYKYFVSVLTYSGYEIQAGETPSQYSDRIDRYFYFRPVKFKDITDIFIKSRYSTSDITDKEKQILMDFISKLLSESKSNMGKARYFIYQKALGKF